MIKRNDCFFRDAIKINCKYCRLIEQFLDLYWIKIKRHVVEIEYCEKIT